MSKHLPQRYYPFSAIIGQDDFKLCLILNLIDPLIGGVLAIGDKGTGKTTLIRSIAQLMQSEGTFPFVNLPVGVTEDRLLGHIDLEKLVNDKKEVIKHGLLHQADQGILYIDEINLLQDYLTDLLLDASATGGYYLEREGLSSFFSSRFCLVGSMNPEEGELRPQLKDRFGLSLNIQTPQETSLRAQIIQHRIAFDTDPDAFYQTYLPQEKETAHKILKAKELLPSIKVDYALIEACAQLAIQHQVEGLRADILLLRTAKAFAAWQGDLTLIEKHLYAISDYVLNHRKKNNPDYSSKPPQPDNQPNPPQENTEQPKEQAAFFEALQPDNQFSKLKSVLHSSKNTPQPYIPSNGNSEKLVDVPKSLSQYLATDRFEIKNKQKEPLSTTHHIFLIDASGSMLKDRLISYAKGAIEKLSTQLKRNTEAYSIISLVEGNAKILLETAQNMQQVEQALQKLETGGKTNIIAGLKKVKQLTANPNHLHQATIITDGKFNSGGDLSEAKLAFQTYCKGLNSAQVIDAEQGIVKLGLAKQFAQQINANYEPLLIGND